MAVALGSAVLAMPALAQDQGTAGMQRGQGSAMTGSSELAKRPMATITHTNPDPNNVDPDSTNAARYGLQRGQGSAVTGSTELAKEPMPTAAPYQSDPENVIGKGPYVGGDGHVVEIQRRAMTPGQMQGVQRGQGTAATGSSELAARPITAPGQ